MSTESEIRFRSDMSVKLISATPEPDRMVVAAARVSTMGASAVDSEEHAGLINFLIKNRHGSPFEHNQFTFLVSAPIFVWREVMRHRIASYNEQSGRYMELDPVFYWPANDRPLQQVGKTGNYTFEEGTRTQKQVAKGHLQHVAIEAYEMYKHMLQEGIAKEVARMCLPLNIYSSAYITMNARALTNFLSLRTQHEDATIVSYPQAEIAMVADEMEKLWAAEMPLTHAAWHKNGRQPI